MCMPEIQISQWGILWLTQKTDEPVSSRDHPSLFRFSLPIAALTLVADLFMAGSKEPEPQTESFVNFAMIAAFSGIARG